MITFLPYSDFYESARALDYKRLGKQRLETHQIFMILKNNYIGYSSHPAVKMWSGYEEMLKLYFNVIVKEWKDRGYKNNYNYFQIDENKLVKPWWLGNEDFHRAMRSRLIEKKPDFYTEKFSNDKGFNNGKYLWPVNETKTFRII